MSSNVKNLIDADLRADSALLPPPQAIVLERLLAGASKKEAAKAAGVTPETVSRWCNQNARFMAAFSQARQALYDAHLVDLMDLRRKAFDALAEMVHLRSPHRVKAIEVALRLTAIRPAPLTDADDGVQDGNIQVTTVQPEL